MFNCSLTLKYLFVAFFSKKRTVCRRFILQFPGEDKKNRIREGMRDTFESKSVGKSRKEYMADA